MNLQSSKIGMSVSSPTLSLDERLKLLYPVVNEEETPLPRSWSPKDKFNYIGLSNANLRVHYKGIVSQDLSVTLRTVIAFYFYQQWFLPRFFWTEFCSSSYFLDSSDFHAYNNLLCFKVVKLKTIR